MRYKNSVSFCVSGRQALFSDPLMRLGGEKCSYQVPTYQALKGILESVYWKPTFVWVIDSVRIVNPIQSQSKGVKTMKYKLRPNSPARNDLSYYTYLIDVMYQVKAHFVWNDARPELADDRNEHKHYEIAKRMIDKGGRRDVFLGTRECQAYVEPCNFGEGKGSYDDVGEITFGLMFHGFTYPDENKNANVNAENELQARFWRPKMCHGVIEFCPPDKCPAVRCIKTQKTKEFVLGNNVSCCGTFEELIS